MKKEKDSPIKTGGGGLGGMGRGRGAGKVYTTGGEGMIYGSCN